MIVSAFMEAPGTWGDQLGNPAWISQLIFADPMGILILAGDWTFSIRMSSTEANIETQ